MILHNPAAEQKVKVVIYRRNMPMGWAAMYDVYGDNRLITKVEISETSKMKKK